MERIYVKPGKGLKVRFQNPQHGFVPVGRLPRPEDPILCPPSEMRRPREDQGAEARHPVAEAREPQAGDGSEPAHQIGGTPLGGGDTGANGESEGILTWQALDSTRFPAELNIPIIAVEFDASQAGATGQTFRSLVIGQRRPAGTVAAEIPFLVSSDAQAEQAAGRGSQLALMCQAFRRAAPFAEVWAVGLDDASGSTQKEITVTVSGTATESGTIALYVAGRRVSVPVADAATASEVATSINTAVGDRGFLPFSSAVAAGVVTLTARNSGTLDLDVRHSYQPGRGVASRPHVDDRDRHARRGRPRYR